MQPINFEEQLDKIIARDARYTRDAYVFLRAALDHTQKLLLKQQKRPESKAVPVHERHVTGRELAEGIRDFALEQFGPMAQTVLNEWGIHETLDFGEMVFNMVDQGLLSKTESDSRDDFKGIYEFGEAFSIPFRPSSKAPSNPPQSPARAEQSGKESGT